MITRGAATRGWEICTPPPTLKARGPPMYCSPHFYHNIYFDWLVPPTYKIIPAPLMITYSRHLKVVKDDMVRKSSGRLFQYFGAATVKAASIYIYDTRGTQSFISSHLRLG